MSRSEALPVVVAAAYICGSVNLSFPSEFKRYSDNDCTEHFCAITVLNSSTHLKAEEFISLGNTCSVNLVHQEKKKFVF